MASVAEARRSPFAAEPHHHQALHKSMPILPSSTASSHLTPPRDPMDLTPSTLPIMGPPMLNGPAATDRNGAQQEHHTNGDTEGKTPIANGNTAPVGAAAAAQQPKVVQTAFIHKLYKSYFKHTNISSFVRQLNMYGFHKVSDVFHTGSPDSPLWEFKHGNGNFKRGDLVGLREIKRRASRHALIHRDSFSTPKVPSGPPTGPPTESMPDPVESRLAALEHGLYDMHARMQRSEDSCAYLSQKNTILMDNMLKCQQWNHDLTNYIMALIPDPENQVYKDAYSMQRDISRQSEMLRVLEGPEEPLSARQPFSMQLDSTQAPLSPRQMPQDNGPEPRRGSLAGLPSRQAQPFKPPVPAHLAISPRRYGSIGTGNYSPSSARTPVTHQPPPPPPPSIQHPGSTLGSNLGASSSPPYNLNRRHTSADIRTHGWPPQPPPHSPYASGQNSTQWPSSPHRTLIGGEDQQLRNALESYQLPRGPRQQNSRQNTPPMTSDTTPSTLSADSSWSLPGARYPFKGLDTPGPPTRRSSMASNVHSLLNPADTQERADEDDPDEARKRKRMQ
ncbi:hypothetical protein PMIN05_008921 [Paraphaeosphaeria minitans]